MEQNFISQTPLDRMVSSDCGQMLKAAIPYLPASGRQILSVYEKAMELKNTISLFGSSTSAPELSAMSIPSREPMEMLNDIRSFCYGSSKKQLEPDRKYDGYDPDAAAYESAGRQKGGCV